MFIVPMTHEIIDRIFFRSCSFVPGRRIFLGRRGHASGRREMKEDWTVSTATASQNVDRQGNG